MGVDSARNKFLITESDFKSKIKDSSYYFYRHDAYFQEKMYIIYDTVWNKDTVHASDLTNPKYIFANGAKYIVDSTNIKTVDAMSLSILNYNFNIKSLFDSIYLYQQNNIIVEHGDFIRIRDNTWQNHISQILPSDYDPEIEIPFVGMKYPYIEYIASKTWVTAFLFADMLALTENGWKIIFPYGTKYYQKGTLTNYLPAPAYGNKDFSMVGLWVPDGNAWSNYNIQFQCNNNDSFAFVRANNDNGTMKIVKGKYLISPYSLSLHEDMVVGQFAYRNPTNSNHWTLTPPNKTDTLPISTKIVYRNMLEDPTLDTFAINHYPIYQYFMEIDTIKGGYFTDTLSLLWNDNGINKIDIFLISKEGRIGVPEYRILNRSNIINNGIIQFDRIQRITNTSDYYWTGILRK